MSKPKYLLVGGLVAMGFDQSGRFLLTVTHSGHGLFSIRDWERVARDHALAYCSGVVVGSGYGKSFIMK